MPPKDRLAEFLDKTTRGSKRAFKWQNHARLRSESEGQLTGLPSGKGSDEVLHTRNGVKVAELFLEKIERISFSVDRLEKELLALKRCQTSTLTSPLFVTGQSDDMYRLLDTFRTSCLDTHRQLQDLDKDLVVARSQLTVTELRICNSQRSGLTGKVSRILGEFSQAQVDYRQRCIQRVQRQLFIVGQPTISQENIEELLSRNEPAMLFTQGIIADSQKAKDTLSDIETRHGELLALEKSIVELRNLFKDLAVMVDYQGQYTSSIERNLTIARDEIKDTGSLLKEARAMKRSARSKKRKLIYVGVIILIILASAVVLAVYFGA